MQRKQNRARKLHRAIMRKSMSPFESERISNDWESLYYGAARDRSELATELEKSYRKLATIQAATQTEV